MWMGKERPFPNELLGDEDGVFKVITFPGHKADQEISPESQLAV